MDYAATTPVDKQVVLVMGKFWEENFGNPAALYEEGRKAKLAREDSRRKIAKILNAGTQEIVFTAGGTESVNLAILGFAKAQKKRPSHFITSTIEHHAVLKSFTELERREFKTTYLPVNSYGQVLLSDLKNKINNSTVFVSVMYANNEVGSIQPIAEIGKWLKSLNRKRLKENLPQIIFHTDASQAAGVLDLDVQKLGVDLLTLNGSKIYGPKQTGILFVRSGVGLEPLILGGGQEKNLRSGTENIPGIVGLAKALELAQINYARENARLLNLRNYFYDRILKSIKNVKLNGPQLDKKMSAELKRLPNNLSLSFLGLEGESLMLYLDAYGISVATGSACAELGTEPSHVLAALGLPKRQVQSSIRITLGKFTTKKDLNYVLTVLMPVVRELRSVKSF